jgi:hypothetical protein
MFGRRFVKAFFLVAVLLSRRDFRRQVVVFASAQEGRKLWKGNVLLGMVPVVPRKEGDFVSLESVANDRVLRVE